MTALYNPSTMKITITTDLSSSFWVWFIENYDLIWESLCHDCRLTIERMDMERRRKRGSV